MTRIRLMDVAFVLAALAIATVAHAQAQVPSIDASAHASALSPTQVTVAIPESIIRGVVANYVEQQLATEDHDDGVRTEIHVRWQGDILLDRPGIVEYRVRKLSDRPFRGPSVTRVEVLVDGKLDRTLTVTVDCRLFQDVVVTARTLRRGTLLLEDDAVEIQERDVTRLKHGYYTSFDELEMMQSRRPIGLGDIITHRHAEPVPVIHRGDQIVMQVRSAHMLLESLGIAMQDGGVGEQIRVRNDDSGKIVRGEILEAGIVRIRGL